MRICASLGIPEVVDPVRCADIVEIRTDVFSEIPKIDMKMIITLDSISKMSMVPDGFDGMIDIGTSVPPDTSAEVISSYHDHEKTPDDILSILDRLKGDIVKGSFFVNSIADLKKIYDASKDISRRHVLIGMGELGKITRIRQTKLGNEFTFAYAGVPTAPGQMSVEEMRSLGDDCIITGLLGTPITDTSRRMHDTAFAYSEVSGKYLLFDSLSIEGISEVMRSYDIRGMNVTIPYKTQILEHLDSLDPVSGSTGSVNTVLNDNGMLKGYNTDVCGIDTAFRKADIDPGGRRALVIGTGGSSRSCIHYLQGRGCEVTVTGRNIDTGKELSERFGCRFIPTQSVPLKMFDMIVNCTPASDPSAIDTRHLDRRHIVFDLIHDRRTDLMMKAGSLGCKTVDPKNMLAAQAAASFKIWTGCSIPFDVMRDAI